MMIAVFERQGHIPNNRGELLKAYVTQSLRREADEKLQNVHLTPELAHELLVPVGFAMQTEGQHLLRSRLDDILGARLRGAGRADVRASAAVDELVETGLLQPVGIDRVRFWHQSIQEYFAGQKLREVYTAAADPDQAWRAVASYVDSSHWHESLAVMAGLLEGPQLDRFFSRCCRRHEQLAAMCVANSDAVPSSLVTEFIVTQRRRALRWMSVSPWTVKMAWFWLVFPICIFAAMAYHSRTGDTALSWTWGPGVEDSWFFGLRVFGKSAFSVHFPMQRVVHWYFTAAPALLRVLWNSISPLLLVSLGFALIWWTTETVIVRAVLRRGIAPPVSALRMLGTSEARTVVSSLVIEAKRSRRTHPRHVAFLEASQLLYPNNPEDLTRILLSDDFALRGMNRSELAAPSTLRQLEVLAEGNDELVALGAIRALSQVASCPADGREQAVLTLSKTVRDRGRAFRVRYGAFRSLRRVDEKAGTRPWPTLVDLRDFWLRHWPPVVMVTAAAGVLTAIMMLLGSPTAPPLATPREFETNWLYTAGFLLMTLLALRYRSRHSAKWQGSYAEALHDVLAMFAWFWTAPYLIMKWLLAVMGRVWRLE